MTSQVRSHMGLPGASPLRLLRDETGLTGEVLTTGRDLSLRTARVARARIHALLFLGLVMHAATNRPPKPDPYIGRHRLPAPERDQRHGNGIAWWIWTAVAVGYAWLTWRMAVIELPTMTGLGAAMTLVLAYTAGRNQR